MLSLKRVLPFALMLCLQASFGASPVVLYTDFGQKDGAVSALKGVAYGVSEKLLISDLSHEDPGSIFAGAYRLFQVAPFWPKGTVFVTVIDPGVGTERLSVVLKTRKGHYFVAPNNGVLTLVAEQEGVEELRQIDERINRRKGSEDSYTFHGRDVFGYTGARLAAGVIQFSQVGPKLSSDLLVKLPYTHVQRTAGGVEGIIPVLDVQYGNVWTNIPQKLFDELGIKVGESVRVRVFNKDQLVEEVVVPYRHTFGEVPVGKPLAYINSLMNFALAINQGNFAKEHHIGSGTDWRITLSKE
ncbi:SAM hydrolase/SAM-dependent halogenase family protein [Uliginosibacterium gangwonense]|uniref:SAM hydrolase/SAM-dependent halogenase family protein n=1 Tax=Uliginosibacterium gangwonense TaxID=392736 RepID=UPI0005249EAC|nr:S-adenosyl-l-methionine hydroxide adenosyltransferase family protein [Uliginosibacterium gangwonense]